MLVGVTRVGPLRQRVAKGFTITGARKTPDAMVVGRIHVVPAKASGLWHASTPLAWFGSPESRSAWMSELAQAIGKAGNGGGQVLPTGVSGADGLTPAGDDVHTLEVASTMEQEVLCNLLREHVPLLVALTGRSVAPGASGSHRLALSREHVAARYLASTSPGHLERVTTDLRRVDGVAQLDRMDVYPSTEPDGSPTVTVRCVDAGASLAATRAHGLLLAAFALRARRLVRDGRRLGHLRQRLLEENRARAVARGLRSRLASDDSGGQTPARDLARTLMTEILSIELDNLRATPEELFPVLAAIDLPQLGLTRASTEDELLRGWATQGAQFAGIAGRVLLDPGPGGPCLSVANQLAPGRTSLLIDEWSAIIAARRGGVTAGQPPKREPSKRDPARSDPSKRDPARSDPSKRDSTRNDPSKRDGRPPRQRPGQQRRREGDNR